MPTPIEETFTCDEMPDESAGVINVMPSVPMPKLVEDEWYKGEEYRQEVNGNCSHEECWHDVYDIEKIIQEATRRGIEKGKREAWEEIKYHIENQIHFLNKNPNETANGFLRATLDHVCIRLSSLSNPQKEV